MNKSIAAINTAALEYRCTGSKIC